MGTNWCQIKKRKKTQYVVRSPSNGKSNINIQSPRKQCYTWTNMSISPLHPQRSIHKNFPVFRASKEKRGFNKRAPFSRWMFWKMRLRGCAIPLVRGNPADMSYYFVANIRVVDRTIQWQRLDNGTRYREDRVEVVKQKGERKAENRRKSIICKTARR